MPNINAKTSSNVFYKARLEASKHNEQLSSRDGAAELMSIDRGRLFRIESGVTDPYPEEVHLMANLYNAPELRNHFCTEICPLGFDTPRIVSSDLDRICLKALASLRKLETTRDMILDLCGKDSITAEDKPNMELIIAELEELETVTRCFKNWVQKNF